MMKRYVRSGKHFFAAMLVLLGMCLLGPGSVFTQAEPAADKPADKTVTEQKPEEKVGKWVTKKGYCYYKVDGKKAKGLVEINGKKYLFDKKGRQKVGWQKINKSYYYFKIKNGKKGYMVKNKTVNGFRLKKNGKAKVSNSLRMNCLWTATQFVERATRPAYSKAVKLRAVWNYFQANIGYGGDPSFSLNGDWGAYYANKCFANGRASCEGLGCAWAFLANACGAKNCYCVCSGTNGSNGHGWSEVGGAVYDPSWDRVDRRFSYFAMSMSMSGHNGIPPYASSGVFRSKI